MIESGSHVPGVSVAAFRLPPHTALRYEQPGGTLAGYPIDYHVLDFDGAVHGDSTQWMLPGWAAIRIILAERPIAVTLGDRRYDPVPAAALYGTTSRALAMTTNGGVTIGIDTEALSGCRAARAGGGAGRGDGGAATHRPIRITRRTGRIPSCRRASRSSGWGAARWCRRPAG